MAKHDIDPVLQHLIRAVNDSGRVAVPIAVSVHGTTLTGALIAQRTYFKELTAGHPLLSALEPSSGLLGKEYAKEAEAESDHHLHVRGSRAGDGDAAHQGLWRISLQAVDGWALQTSAEPGEQDDKGPFARLLGNS
jgi:hypothetical protein